MPAVVETSSGGPLDGIVQQQLVSLDDTDAYASVWSDLLTNAGTTKPTEAFLWGGRGQGGRGLARRTYQPRDIVVDDVRLEFVGIQDSQTKQTQLPSKLLLEGATLKLLPGQVYALVGRNGVGKSTLLRRIQAGKIPGFPTHVATLYIPQELPMPSDEECSALQLVQDQFALFSKATCTSLQHQMELLEKELDELQDDEQKMEELCEEISEIQDAMDQANQYGEDAHTTTSLVQLAKESLAFFDIDEELSAHIPYNRLSPGRRKKVALAVAVLCASAVSPSQQFLLCLDEPTNHLDVAGLIKLRQFLLSGQDEKNRTVLLVSHDTDLLNDVATNTIIFSHRQKTLAYYTGNYRDYLKQSSMQELHLLRQQVSLDKKRNHLIQNIQHIKDQPAPRRGGNRKKAKMISAQRKKLDRQGVEKNEKGHRRTQQQAGTGIKAGSINGIDASTRKDLSTSELLQLAEASVRPPPDKAVQFVFRDTGCAWDEPLIMAMDVGHGYGAVQPDDNTPPAPNKDEFVITKKPGYLFDCVDLCINEGRKYCLLGANASGKSVLLKILAKQEDPLEGTVHHAHNVQIGYFGQETMDQLIKDATTVPGTALEYLSKRFQRKASKISEDFLLTLA
ncbi:Uncharacterized ABC transporter ATP-binding protein YbiT [Seminavis robusta]|uniref:Uncharacterized ABC transporter ATP-binding protein YbiT n=1 Tax=Seminavis robusta TaxID=568900 RepID=A0A9N8DW46_9STRA|nr:Uncharacterized ABC transporter ATP-binding protein YbiT [Seminavis robusta]|eukprot:Sro402_g135510.1 Uncharacterized ABC transporter ATP-binding protein YbiT (620) ;mRNA; f:57538-59478